MRLSGRIVVVTGAAGGIGRALALRFAAEGAAGICLTDLPGAALDAVADEVRALGVPVLARPGDVAVEADVRAAVADTEHELGPVDLYCANAGFVTGAGLDATDEQWQRSWSVHVLAHVYAARTVLPGMLARGDGYFMVTASAAGLLTGLGDAPYTATKHAAVGFAEWLAATYGDQGIRVSALCPQGVNTPLLTDGLSAGHPGARSVAAAGAIIEPALVADAVIAGLAEERFLILPHPEVAEFQRRKAADPDRWLAAVRRLR